MALDSEVLILMLLLVEAGSRRLMKSKEPDHLQNNQQMDSAHKQFDL